VFLQFQIFPSAFLVAAWKRSKISLMLLVVTQRFAILSIRSSSEVGRSQKLAKTTATAQFSTWVQSRFCWEALSSLTSKSSVPLLSFVWQNNNIEQSRITLNHLLQTYPNAVDSIPLLRTSVYTRVTLSAAEFKDHGLKMAETAVDC
jgi:hypothetical protein